jgi:PTS system cellobiose-specific IIB component
MTTKILLACAGGFSTSMLVERMRAAVTAQGLDISIEATAEGKLDKLVDQADIILLGPQVGHMEKTLKEKFAMKPVLIGTIASIDYGMMNGEKVLQDALSMT